MPAWIESNFFMINMLPLCLVFSAKLKKREHFVLRLAVGILCSLLGSSLMDFTAEGMWGYLSGFGILVVFCFFFVRYFF